MPAPWVIAHRGASGTAPENTMAAFRRATELGARFIETDLHLSRDGAIVAIHDPTLDRTTSGRGPVMAHSLEELRTLDAGSWFSPEFAGEQIPTLDEILGFAAQADVNLYLEIKGESGYGIERALVAALRGRVEAMRVVVLSFDPPTLELVRRLDRVIMTGLLWDDDPANAVERAMHIGARQLAPRGDSVNAELVADAHTNGLQVVTWTINAPEHIRALAAAGVDGIMSDYPDRVLAVLNEMKL
jgi:glycerophosphoryl diester phosphodiesterase